MSGSASREERAAEGAACVKSVVDADLAVDVDKVDPVVNAGARYAVRQCRTGRGCRARKSDASNAVHRW